MSVDSIGKYLELSCKQFGSRFVHGGTWGIQRVQKVQGIQALEPDTRGTRGCKIQRGTQMCKGPEGMQFKFLNVMLSLDCHKWMKHK